MGHFAGFFCWWVLRLEGWIEGPEDVTREVPAKFAELSSNVMSCGQNPGNVSVFDPFGHG